MPSDWKGEAPAATGRKASHYVIFETSCGDLAGGSGSPGELRPGIKTQAGRLDSPGKVVKLEQNYRSTSRIGGLMRASCGIMAGQNPIF